MFEYVISKAVDLSFKGSITRVVFYGILTRLVALFYCICHDSWIQHIKYTDIDYHVFTNGSKALLEGSSPYTDKEYRYTPLVAIIFTPNLLVNKHFGKFVLVAADSFCALLLYRLNIYQGVTRQLSKLYLMLWLFNPMTVGISTRGSFEPILSCVILSSIYLLVTNHYISSGLLLGFAVHLKLYPIIYSLPIYIYLVDHKAYFVTQERWLYWMKTLIPNRDHFRFFTSMTLSSSVCSYLCYKYYGYEYIDQSILYHMRRIDMQHNFSIYFFIFKLFPKQTGIISFLAPIIQLIGILLITKSVTVFDTNKRNKIRRLYFLLFSSTFMFVALNKVCTSQYFTWFLLFCPLIMDNIDLPASKLCNWTVSWILAQLYWLVVAYMYEYQKLDVVNYVGGASFVMLFANLGLILMLVLSFIKQMQLVKSIE